MARTNGPIQVWHRTDTIPSDAEGGYAGGDSTAAAIGTVGAQAQAALNAVQNALSVSRDATTGRLYFGVPPPPPIFEDNFDRDDESPAGATPVGWKTLTPLSPTTTRVEGRLLALGGATTRAAFWDAGQADGVYTITVANADSQDTTHGFGVIFRADTTAYQNALVLDGSGTASEGVGTYRLRRRVAGSYSNIQLGGVVANGDVIAVTMLGATITITVNGQALYTGEPGPEFTGSLVGVQNLNNRNAVRFDNASFEQIGA